MSFRFGDARANRICVLLVFLNVVFCRVAVSQSGAHHWTGFEDGKLGDGMLFIGSAPSRAMRVVELSSVTGMPKQFYGTPETGQNGRFVLELSVAPETGVFTEGLAINMPIDRSKLGENGRAVIEADFFIPGKDEIPSLAVLAMAPPETGASGSSMPIVTPKKFYRFGLTLGHILYFSYVTPEKDKPVAYRTDNPLLTHMPHPGWHRFTMVVSAGEVSCYVDARGTGFSPVEEKNNSNVLVGVMLADSKRSYKCYVDNLSIRVLDDKARIQDSPYSQGWKVPAGDAVLKPGQKPGSFALRNMNWREPEDAWTYAQEQKRALLLFFYGLGYPPSDRVGEMLTNNPDADRVLQSYSCARIDVNQVKGSELARKYDVKKVPTFLIISHDGKSAHRILPSGTESWSEIAGKLQGAAKSF